MLPIKCSHSSCVIPTECLILWRAAGNILQAFCSCLVVSKCTKFAITLFHYLDSDLSDLVLRCHALEMVIKHLRVKLFNNIYCLWKLKLLLWSSIHQVLAFLYLLWFLANIVSSLTQRDFAFIFCWLQRRTYSRRPTDNILQDTEQNLPSERTIVKCSAR